MFRLFVSRVLGMVPTLLMILTASFLMMRLTPGGPFDNGRVLPAEIQANLNRAYHLDEPLGAQYLRYLGNLARGDFGPSFSYRNFTVTELIAQGFPVSLTIGAAAMALGLLIGLGVGTASAVAQGSVLDRGLMMVSMTGLILPSFVTAPALSLIFGVYLKWLPAGGWGDGLELRYMVLPILALALPQIAAIARLTRNSLIETLQFPFIRTARAKGLPEWIVLTRHAIRPAILPVISYLGPATAGIITGSIIIEQIFSIPGIGRYFVLAALNRDYTLVTGVVVFYGALILIFNLIVDLIFASLDPRLRIT